MNETMGFDMVFAYVGRLLLHAAADLADQDDAVGALVLIQRVSASRVVVPIIGSPPMPMKAECPSPARWIEADERAEVPLREMTPTRPGWNTCVLSAGMMPTKHFARRDRPAVLGPMMRDVPPRARHGSAMTSRAGICSVKITTSLPAGARSRRARRPWPAAE